MLEKPKGAGAIFMSLTKSKIYKDLSIYLDLAVEAHELVRGETGTEIPGVVQEVEEYDFANVTTVKVIDPQGASLVGKPMGNYITIDAPKIRENNLQIHEEISKALADTLKKLAPLKDDATVLLVGLGNWNATPDALGPQVIKYSLVTRHI